MKMQCDFCEGKVNYYIGFRIILWFRGLRRSYSLYVGYNIQCVVKLGDTEVCRIDTEPVFCAYITCSEKIKKSSFSEIRV
jgi:hypothetical protein